MAGSKIPSSTVHDIRRMNDEGRDPAVIARDLDLSRMQVTSILAHFKLQSVHEERPVDNIDVEPPSDLWFESTPISIANQPSAIVEKEEEAEIELSGIFVGEEAEYDTPIMWDPANAREVHNPHLMIMGESGSGKTYAQQCLIAELANADIPSVIFDFGQSFERETLDRSFQKYFQPKEHLIGEEGLDLNPLQIFEKDKGPNTVAVRLADVFDAVFGLGPIQKKVLIDAILRSYGNVGITQDDTRSWRNKPPSMLALRDAIDDMAVDRQHYPHYKNAAGLSARLTTFFMLAAFRTDREDWSWDRLIRDKSSRVHILQFRGLEGKTQRVLVELLLWHLFYHLKTHGQNSLHMFCVLDEAHHLSFRESGPMNALLREARKFGIGIIFASQQPEDFSPVAYSNSASKLIFQTSDPALKVSKYLAGKATNFERAEEIRDTISDLPRGDAFFISKNRGYVVRVTDFPKRATTWGLK